MNQNGHIWYFLAIFVAGTFWPLSERASCWTDALISPHWKNDKGFIAQKITKYGRSDAYYGNFPVFQDIEP